MSCTKTSFVKYVKLTEVPKIREHCFARKRVQIKTYIQWQNNHCHCRHQVSIIRLFPQTILGEPTHITCVVQCSLILTSTFISALLGSSLISVTFSLSVAKFSGKKKNHITMQGRTHIWQTSQSWSLESI